jgi:AcrR family transcriptional regulator
MRSEERKKKILNCAKKLFSKNGFYKTQISDIAKAANIARGTIYQYFENKDIIYMTLLEDYYRIWQDQMNVKNSNIDLGQITAVDFFKSQIRKTLDFFANDRYLSNIILRVGLGVPGDLASTIKRFESHVLDFITRDLRLGIKTGNIRDDIDIEFTANLIAGSVLRTASYYFGPYKRKKPLDVEKATNDIISLFVKGLFTDRALKDAGLI